MNKEQSEMLQLDLGKQFNDSLLKLANPNELNNLDPNVIAQMINGKPNLVKYEPLFKFWIDVFINQDSLNKKISNNWEKMNLKWYRALNGELFEFTESFNWEWWKTKPHDLLNAEVELIDSFHFLVAMILNTNQSRGIYTITSFILFINTIEENKMLGDFESLVSFAEDFIQQNYLYKNNYIGLQMVNFAKLWQGFSSTKGADTLLNLVKLYFAKNTLNNFRKDNGYKDGSYVKIWGEEEDNYYCFQIAKKLELVTTDEFKPTLYNELTKLYKEFI